MANKREQSQFRRFLSSGIFVALTLFWLGAAGSAHADDHEAASPLYRPVNGESFFLLSETSFGSDQVATVRLEVPRNSWQLREYGGVDIAIYKVPDPVAFLRAQDNLHRVKIPTRPQPEGMANMLRVSWDKIWVNSRFAWQRVFSSEARQAATSSAPELRTPDDIFKSTRVRHQPAYASLPGMQLAERFRYPIQSAKPIAPPKGVKLAGSSSEFLPSFEGNIRVPIGKREPGLYLVEAFIGKHRALTLVFVSDSVAVTKNASEEIVLWSADRKKGTPVAGTEVFWSDGVGVIKSGRTNADGIARLAAKSPESSFVFGVDPSGGVFISENFYHDSEIYNAKIYAVTDRPLYRPGDLVQVKFLGREFKSARRSEPVPSGDIELTLVDPAGTQILSRKLHYDANQGSQTSFHLPEIAQAGGWELVFAKGEDVYGAAFRVADYVKPHFEIDIVADKKEFKTKEAVTGRIRLSYPDGKPVANALVRLTARAQPLTMVEGELRYGGQFPIAIKATELETDKDGETVFDLPPSDAPARYILSLLAQDGAAYRVRANREMLIERGATLWQISAPTYFSKPGEQVEFSFRPQSALAFEMQANRPGQWEIIRLEDREIRTGEVGQDNILRLDFDRAGSYTVSLRDAGGNLVAATSHWISGDGLKAIPGSVEIVLDKESYRAGETAQALITFPHPVDNALLTLERDKVENYALLGSSADWVNVSQVAPAQWKAEIPVKSEHGPNVTFSVLYLNDGDYVFQNKGLRVAVPTVDISIQPEKERYAPGETVRLEIQTQLDGKAAPALINLGVVDEMIYVLQPEIAPDINNFFYHPRRNNVRTAVSLSFIGYDLARMPANGGAPIHNAPAERGIKILERPRRDDTDTAGWWPSLKTDANGKANVSFTMPDALTRWRITARAVTPQGVVGQQTGYIESHKDFYAKWTGPATFRQGDQPTAAVVAFNQTGAETKVELLVAGAGMDVKQTLALKPGANNVLLPFASPENGEMKITLQQAGRPVDSLVQAVNVISQHWLSERGMILSIDQAATPLHMPADAQDIRVSLAQGSAAQFARIADDLLHFPWGCAEQVSSRLIPLSLIYAALPADSPYVREIAQTLSTQRLRLVQMAGPDALFGWWGPMTGNSAWMTAYAYYADWHAARALGLSLPPEHWRNVLNAYSKYAKDEPLYLRTLAVWFMAEMQLPVRNVVEGLLKEAESMSIDAAASRKESLWLGTPSTETQAVTLVMLAQLAGRNNIQMAPLLAERIDSAREALREQPDALGQALLAMELKGSREALKEQAARALATIGPAVPTLDRALALAWWNKALNGNLSQEAVSIKLGSRWKALPNPFGAPTWAWTGKAMPAELALPVKPQSELTAVVRYRSAEEESARLPVTIERNLYRLIAVKPEKSNDQTVKDAEPRIAPLVGEAAEFMLEKANDLEIYSNELYLEEIVVSPGGGIMPRFGLLEVPLPPGADVESGTWGIRIRDGGTAVQLEKARHQPGELSYGVPIDVLSESQRFRHLLRFGSRGSFVLPPARFHRMYQPEEKAFEAVLERHVTVK